MLTLSFEIEIILSPLAFPEVFARCRVEYIYTYGSLSR